MKPIKQTRKENQLKVKLPIQKKYKRRGLEANTLRSPGYFILFAVLLSIIIHFSSFLSLSHIKKDFSHLTPPKSQPIKINIVEKKPDPQEAKKLVETPLKKTEPAQDAKHYGVNDHQTKKETIKKKANDKQLKLARAGKRGNSQNENKKDTTKKDLQKVVEKVPEKTLPPNELPGSYKGSLTIAGAKKRSKPRNAYEKLLNQSFDQLQGEIDAGYQEYIDYKAEEGERIDLNTQEYRYVGYFTVLRKSIELVWNYPIDAARKGWQGTVQLEFTIAANGDVSNIKVLNSSGYSILDRAIVDALKLASPFAPLPKGFGKERLVISGSFNYVLQGYASGH
ncbi:MAG: energy transducer TonB [Bdellovibrionota bacterium]